MRIRELLTERALRPDKDLSKKFLQVLKNGIKNYFETEDETSPDPDRLRDSFEKESKGLPFKWNVAPDDAMNPVTPYIHSAALTMQDEIAINLHAETIESNWDEEEFIKYAMYSFNHEAVHHEQAMRKNAAGYEQPDYGGIAKARRKAKGDESMIMHYYLADKEEIMAHAKDLATEMSLADDPGIVLRDPDGFIDYLPTWQKYRYVGKYSRKDPVIKRLLKYTAAYLGQDDEA